MWVTCVKHVPARLTTYISPSVSRSRPPANAIFVPSGDQAGSRHPMASGSAFGPPQPELGGTVSGRSPEPSLCMTQSELCTSGVTCRENAISFPWRDQLNVQQLADTVGGRIRLRPVPFTFTTNTPS